MENNETNKQETRTLTTTTTGFNTYNAVPGILSAEIIESWYKERPGHDLSNVVGMDKIKERLKGIADTIVIETNNILNVYYPPVIFYGLSGSGKTYIIESFISELMNPGFKYLKINAGEILSNYEGHTEKIIESVFNEAIDQAPSVLFFDDFELLCSERSRTDISNRKKDITVSFLIGLNKIINTEKKVVMICSTNMPGDIDRSAVDKSMLIRIPLPDHNARKIFFENKLSMIYLSDDIDFEYMGELTENYSFRDLNRLCSELMNEFLQDILNKKAKYDKDGNNIGCQISDEDIKNAIRSGEQKLSKELFDRVSGGFKVSDKSLMAELIEKFDNEAGSVC